MTMHGKATFAAAGLTGPGASFSEGIRFTDFLLRRLGASLGNLLVARRAFRLFAWIERPDHLVECFQTPVRLPTARIFHP